MDLALLKANIPFNCISKNYSFLDSSQLNILEPIVLLTRWERKIKIKGGLGFRQESLGNENMLLVNVNGKHGDSGGIISNREGQIIGDYNAFIKNSNAGICMNSNRMLDLVRFAKKSLESKI